MAKRHWVDVQNKLRALAARACRQVEQFNLARELEDRDFEGETFADVVDSPNCDLDRAIDPMQYVNEKVTTNDARELADEAVCDMLDALVEKIECERCGGDASSLYRDKKFRNCKEYKAYVKAVKAFVHVQLKAMDRDDE